MESIDKLKTLTFKLPEIPTLDTLVTDSDPSKHFILYNMIEGLSFGFSLLNRKEVSVMDLFVAKGTKWPSHMHSIETELGIVYKGSLKVTLGDVEEQITVGDHVYFEKGMVHSAEALEDTRLIAISIPRAVGYAE
jgi:quercetin dioxygenase-like cupin family protein